MANGPRLIPIRQAAQALELARKIQIDCATGVPRNVVVPTQRVDQANAKSLFGKQPF
jgi:ribose transport system substrate-binding protein